MTTSMTKEAAARIQSATAKANHGIVTKDSFAAKAMSIAAKAEIVKPIPQTKAITQPKPNMTSNKQMSSNQHEDNWPSKVPNHDSGKRRTNNPPKR